MPKSATMDARHALLEQQFYATVQRQKTPALTPFSSGYEVDTIEQLKRAVRSQVIIDWFCTPMPVLYSFTQTSGLR